MKHNTLKRLASLATAGALALSLAVPAFASEPDGITQQGGNIDYEVGVNAPVIEVDLAAVNAGVTLNPYELAFEFNGEEVTQDVITATSVIRNNTTLPVDVDVTVTGSIGEGSGAAFKSSSAAGSTSKEVYLAFLMQGIDDPGEDVLGDPARLEEVATWPTAVAMWGTSDVTAGTAWNSKALIAAGGKKAAVLPVENGGATLGDTAANQYYVMAAKTVENGVETPSFAACKLIGDMADTPAEAWTEADAVGVSVAFTFTIVNPASLGA